MKKLFIIALTTVMAAAFAIPASAVENEFGGYWRTRAYTMIDTNGTENYEKTKVDTRTRLYYTAKFSDDFKFVNKFEFNTVWGDAGAGDIGADGNNFLLKNSYVDFNTGPMNFKIGMQGLTLARGFLFDDDFAGLNATYKAGKNTFSAVWIKYVEEEEEVTNQILAQEIGAGETVETAAETDLYLLTAKLNLSDTLAVSPYLLSLKAEGTDTQFYNVGVDLDMKVNDTTSVWSTLIYDSGEYDNGTTEIDADGFLVALGADAGIVHGQFFYATGQDTSNDITAFAAPYGQCYYWAEIMGEGTVDTGSSNNSPGGSPSNIMALNVGTTLKPMDKLTVKADIWYANLVEEIAVAGNMEDDLGIEFDLKATYKVLDNLKLDVVAAYLVAGDATGEEDPVELSTQLSLSF